jgi:hypothetical protein
MLDEGSRVDLLSVQKLFLKCELDLIGILYEAGSEVTRVRFLRSQRPLQLDSRSYQYLTTGGGTSISPISDRT